MNNPINWFEIATNNIDRAKDFYTEVFGIKFELVEMPGTKMYMFDGGPDKKGAMGALVQSEENIPSKDGTIIYFECEDVSIESGRVENAGGILLFSKISIDEYGFISQCIDTEGNRIGFYSNK